ncbi:MAG TPA: hypothetical protein VKZ59_09225 [Acidobacteriota bacterium]|nr:hypothetical protein [Acidobacteriota bacterium]
MIEGSLSLNGSSILTHAGQNRARYRLGSFRLFSTFSLLYLLLLPISLQAQSNWEEVREIAGSQHEIVMLLIEKKEFAKVPAAARKIFEMQFPDEQQHLLVKEAEILTDALLQHDQTQIAHQVIEMARRAVKTNKLKAALYREQAYVYKKEGNSDAAMECFQKSIELEKSGS